MYFISSPPPVVQFPQRNAEVGETAVVDAKLRASTKLTTHYLPGRDASNVKIFGRKTFPGKNGYGYRCWRPPGEAIALASSRLYSRSTSCEAICLLLPRHPPTAYCDCINFLYAYANNYLKLAFNLFYKRKFILSAVAYLAGAYNSCVDREMSLYLPALFLQ